MMSKQLLVISNVIGHAVAGAGIVYLMVTGKIDPTAGAAILAGLGGFWSGVGTALKTAGNGTAVTVPVPTSVVGEVAPTPVPSIPREAVTDAAGSQLV
jgi:hypothetical protein